MVCCVIIRVLVSGKQSSLISWAVDPFPDEEVASSQVGAFRVLGGSQEVACPDEGRHRASQLQEFQRVVPALVGRLEGACQPWAAAWAVLLVALRAWPLGRQTSASQHTRFTRPQLPGQPHRSSVPEPLRMTSSMTLTQAREHADDGWDERHASRRPWVDRLTGVPVA